MHQSRSGGGRAADGWRAPAPSPLRPAAPEGRDAVRRPRRQPVLRHGDELVPCTTEALPGAGPTGSGARRGAMGGTDPGPVLPTAPRRRPTTGARAGEVPRPRRTQRGQTRTRGHRAHAGTPDPCLASGPSPRTGWGAATAAPHPAAGSGRAARRGAPAAGRRPGGGRPRWHPGRRRVGGDRGHGQRPGDGAGCGPHGLRRAPGHRRPAPRGRRHPPARLRRGPQGR